MQEFRSALKKCEEDASNPNSPNSLFILQNFTNLVQTAMKTFKDIAKTNFTEGLASVQKSIDRVRNELQEPNGYLPLTAD